MTNPIDFLLHFDKYLIGFVDAHGAWWVYGLLFLIIFAETGFVVTPFLPGDSLLFAAGALAATGALSPVLTILLLFTAAFTGNALNYSIGRAIGPRVFHRTDGTGRWQRLLNRQHLDRAHQFFEEYGGRALVLGRFVPIVRTFVPFVAGAARMSSATFVFYNFVGAAGWVVLCVGAGIIFGGIPFVRNNFSLVTIGIVTISMIPVLVEYLRHRAKQRTK